MNNEEKTCNSLGSLLLFRNATKEDIDLMLNLISSDKYEFISILRTQIDDVTLIKILDMLSGIKVQFPERRKIYNTLERIFMYNYVKSRDFTQEAYSSCAKQFNRRTAQVKAIIENMIKNIDKAE